MLNVRLELVEHILLKNKVSGEWTLGNVWGFFRKLLALCPILQNRGWVQHSDKIVIKC